MWNVESSWARGRFVNCPKWDLFTFAKRVNRMMHDTPLLWLYIFLLLLFIKFSEKCDLHIMLYLVIFLLLTSADGQLDNTFTINVPEQEYYGGLTIYLPTRLALIA